METPYRIDILTLFPDILSGPLSESIIKRAKSKKRVEIEIHNLRDYSEDKHKRADDYPYGGGAGMVLRVEPIASCIDSLMDQRSYDEIIFLTPDGQPLDQGLVNQLSLKKSILLLAGHYKGIDHRIREHYITREISIGDYVLTGGELPAAVLTDAIVRILPGVIGDETSALSDSHQDGLLSAPVYTRPANYRGWSVPEVLLSGDAQKIEQWRADQAMERTKSIRPDLYIKLHRSDS